MKRCGVKKVLVINRRKLCSTARKDVASHWQHEPEVCAILGTATVMTNKVFVSQVIASSGDDIKTNRETLSFGRPCSTASGDRIGKIKVRSQAVPLPWGCARVLDTVRLLLDFQFLTSLQ